jgi:hypothetical protein
MGWIVLDPATAARKAFGKMAEIAVPAGQLAGKHMDGLRYND